MDLWALLSITAPGLFPHADRFAEYYRPPIERHGDTARLEQLRRRIRPLMLRRTKAAVAAELPPKQEQVVEIELHPRHQRLYQTHLQRERQKVLGLIDDLDQNRFTVLRSLTLLRRLSLDAALLDEANAGDPGGQGRGAARRPGRDRRRGTPGPGVQPVHQLPGPDPRPGSTRPGSRTPTSTGAPGTGIGWSQRFRDGEPPRSS